MDAEAVKMAAEVAKHISAIWWLQLAIQVALTIAAAAGLAYYGGYLKTRGEQLATKADFEDLKKQLSESTKVVEEIKSEVG